MYIIEARDRYFNEKEKYKIKPKNLGDEMKAKLLKVAYEKYEIEELMNRLDIKWNEF